VSSNNLEERRRKRKEKKRRLENRVKQEKKRKEEKKKRRKEEKKRKSTHLVKGVFPRESLKESLCLRHDLNHIGISRDGSVIDDIIDFLLHYSTQMHQIFQTLSIFCVITNVD
jgi:hypothetical protein